MRVAFPYADRQATRVCPALALATAAATDAFGIVWVLMITSARHPPWPDDVTLSDLAHAGLSRASIVRIAKVAVIDQRLVTPIGRLSAADRPAVTQGLLRHLGPALTG